MKTLKVFWTKGKWVFLVILAVCLTVLGFVIRGLFHSPQDSGIAKRLPDVPKPLKAKVEKAETAALVAKAESKVKANYHKKELAVIMEEDDGAERRKKLADLLNRL